jgi:cell division protein FtsB
VQIIDGLEEQLAALQARLDAYSWEAENTALREQVALLRDALAEAMYCNSTDLAIRLADEALEKTK